MYSFGNHMRRDPFAPDPLGIDMDRLQNPDPYLNQFQFAQDPNSMTPPSMGLDSAGGVAQAPFMQGMDAGGGNPAYGAGGSNMAGGLMAASKMANSMANEEKSIPLPGVGKAAQGEAMQFMIPYAKQIAALQELMRNRPT